MFRKLNYSQYMFRKLNYSQYMFRKLNYSQYNITADKVHDKNFLKEIELISHRLFLTVPTTTICSLPYGANTSFFSQPG